MRILMYLMQLRDLNVKMIALRKYDNRTFVDAVLRWSDEECRRILENLPQAGLSNGYSVRQAPA
jgi:hypothetical protein